MHPHEKMELKRKHPIYTMEQELAETEPALVLEGMKLID